VSSRSHPGAICAAKPLDARSLARRLKPYEVRPDDVRIGEEIRKGYKREDLHDAWRRYLPQTSATSATAATDAGQRPAEVAPVADVAAAGETVGGVLFELEPDDPRRFTR
jgi:hypothetical protein